MLQSTTWMTYITKANIFSISCRQALPPIYRVTQHAQKKLVWRKWEIYFWLHLYLLDWWMYFLYHLNIVDGTVFIRHGTKCMRSQIESSFRPKEICLAIFFIVHTWTADISDLISCIARNLSGSPVFLYPLWTEILFTHRCVSYGGLK